MNLVIVVRVGSSVNETEKPCVEEQKQKKQKTKKQNLFRGLERWLSA